MSELKQLLPQVQDIVDRATKFQANEPSDPKEFSKSVVEDLETLARAVSELIRQAQS